MLLLSKRGSSTGASKASGNAPARSGVILRVQAPKQPASASSNGKTDGSGNGYYAPTTNVAAQQRSADIRKRRDQRPSLRSIQPRGSVCAVVLGGGETDSRRLFPLTDKRTLPAIPIGGQYRLIDIPLSNLLNSSINKVFVLTQYNSTSLNRYLQHTYTGNGGLPLGGDGFLEVVAATQGPKEQRWAEGPADTVRQWLQMFEGNMANRFIEDVMVLPSDQVYSFDFTQLVDFHRQTNADLTIVCRPMAEEKMVEHFGVVKLSAGGTRIQAFEEKPSGEVKAAMSMSIDEIQGFMNESHVNSVPFLDMADRDRTWIASCGMYLFRKEALSKMLKGNMRAKDFGRQLIPEAIKAGMKVMAYNFPDYWVDIGGSIGEFYDFNIKLAKDELPFSFSTADSPFFTSPQNLPPTFGSGATVRKALVGAGCVLGAGTFINSSVIGARAILGERCIIEESVIMGADYYEEEKEWPKKVGPNYPHIGVGAGSVIKKAIVDKNARIGFSVQLTNKEGVFESMDRITQGVAIRDGIIVVSKSAVVPDGTVV